MDGQNVDAGLDDLIAVRVQRAAQLRGVDLDLLDQHDRAACRDRPARALDRLQFHPFDVELDEVDTRQAELVQRQFSDIDGVLIIDRLADELVAAPLAQLQAAEA